MEIDEGSGTIIEIYELLSSERVPIGVPYINNEVNRKVLNDWWSGRSIPASRSGLRDALVALKISSPQLLLTKCFGFSLSDQYWVRPENSNLRWEDMNFFDNPFSEDMGNILFGEVPKRSDLNLVSPDNTSDGWLKKKWIIADGKRQLIKSGSNPAQQEPYNEVLASAIMRRLNIEHIPYSLMKINGVPYSVCDDFVTRDTELVAAWHIIQTQKKSNSTSSYQHCINCCEDLGITDVTASLDRMLTVDFIIVNEDRHFNNFGAIRNANTLEWIGAAPIFDCGTSMWYDKFTHMISTTAKLPSKPFRSRHADQIKLVSSFKWLDIKALKGIDEEFREILSDSVIIDDTRCNALCYGLRKRVEQLDAYVKSRGRSHGAR